MRCIKLIVIWIEQCIFHAFGVMCTFHIAHNDDPSNRISSFVDKRHFVRFLILLFTDTSDSSSRQFHRKILQKKKIDKNKCVQNIRNWDSNIFFWNFILVLHCLAAIDWRTDWLCSKSAFVTYLFSCGTFIKFHDYQKNARQRLKSSLVECCFFLNSRVHLYFFVLFLK